MAKLHLEGIVLFCQRSHYIVGIRSAQPAPPVINFALFFRNVSGFFPELSWKFPDFSMHFNKFHENFMKFPETSWKFPGDFQENNGKPWKTRENQ